MSAPNRAHAALSEGMGELVPLPYLNRHLWVNTLRQPP